MRKFFLCLLTLTCCLNTLTKAQNTGKELQVAFLADVHLQDLYSKFQDSDYKGVLNPRNGKYTLLRTMDTQLHSTRIFNENYFAFLAALDDIVKRGIHYVVLPGDYSDDGQPIHVRGLQQILQSYSQKHQIEFFITTGNHDPVGPFEQEAGKNDFLGTGGKRQPIFSKQNLYTPDQNLDLPVVISKDISKMGYAGITNYLAQFGFSPKPQYLYWATPFSSYTTSDYTFEKASQAGLWENRNYDVAPGYTVPDASYLVEPVKGLWLLAIDGNVYIPNTNGTTASKDPKTYSGADLGYNNVLSHKTHLINWIKTVAAAAKKQGKTLIAFSHYPMVEFNDDASAEIAKLMGPHKWQLDRVPQETVAQVFADAGIQVHFGGHMHINDTGIRTSTKGNTIVNIQTPSLAAYIPAYKLLTIKSDAIQEIQTIAINEVPRFNELFDLYKIEHKFLKQQGAKNIWNEAILHTKNYHDFTDYHLKELVRLRFLPEDWPLKFKDFMLNISGKDLLILANLNDQNLFDQVAKNKNQFKNELKVAEVKTKQILSQHHLKMDEFSKWNGTILINDFYRIRSADQLAITDIGKKRITAYKLIAKCYLDNHKTVDVNHPLRHQTWLFFTILDKFLKGAPADHFLINLTNGSVQDISNNQ